MYFNQIHLALYIYILYLQIFVEIPEHTCMQWLRPTDYRVQGRTVQVLGTFVHSVFHNESFLAGILISRIIRDFMLHLRFRHVCSVTAIQNNQIWLTVIRIIFYIVQFLPLFPYLFSDFLLVFIIPFLLYFFSISISSVYQFSLFLPICPMVPSTLSLISHSIPSKFDKF
jgi:hypothetical protein